MLSRSGNIWKCIIKMSRPNYKLNRVINTGAFVHTVKLDISAGMVDIQSAKINDRGSKKTHPGPNTTLSLLH